MREETGSDDIMPTSLLACAMQAAASAKGHIPEIQGRDIQQPCAKNQNYQL
jgi:hypothetical protein